MSCSGVRPFGVSLLIAGYDEVNGPSLYQVDPSGSYWAWKASAIGKNMINAKTFLEKRYIYTVSMQAIRALKSCFFSFIDITRKWNWKMRYIQQF